MSCKVEELKALGNESIKKESYSEAVIHYSHAIKLTIDNAVLSRLHSNRSLAFLKLYQYYYALEDAKETIKLDPHWAKGYYRQAEVQFATRHFSEALLSYRMASEFIDDNSLAECIIKTKHELERQKKFDNQLMWVGAGIGLIMGVLLVVADAILPKNSVFISPVIQTLIVIIFSFVGLAGGYCYKWHILSQRKSLLDPPVDFLGEEEQFTSDGPAENEASSPPAQKHHTRYSKSQARQRYKKGKS